MLGYISLGNLKVGERGEDVFEWGEEYVYIYNICFRCLYFIGSYIERIWFM